MVRTGRLATDRIVLRAFESTDLEALRAYLNEASMIGRRYIPWKIRDLAPLTVKQTEGVLDAWAEEKKGFTLAIALQETGELVGHAGCNWHWDAHCPGIDLAISPAHQRRGVGAEVAKLLLAYLFENTPAHNVSSWASDWNEAAMGFARSLGFTESGRIPRCGIRDGRFVEDVIFDMLRPEWEAIREGEDAHGA